MPQRMQNRPQPTCDQGSLELMEEYIRLRAYQLFEERGCQHGHDVDDWLQAEYELMQLPIRKLAELEPSAARKHPLTGKSVVTLVQAALIASSQGLHELLRWR